MSCLRVNWQTRVLAWAVAVVLAVALASCADEQPARSTPRPTPPLATNRAATKPQSVTTDAKRYVMKQGAFGPEVTIVSQLHALPGRTLHVMNCNGAMSVGLQRLVGNAWVNAWIPTINGCHSAPIVVRAGEPHTYALTSRPRAGAVLHPRESHDGMIEPGTYRVVWFNVLTTYDLRARPHGEELPLDERVSAPVTIERPR